MSKEGKGKEGRQLEGAHAVATLPRCRHCRRQRHHMPAPRLRYAIATPRYAMPLRHASASAISCY